MKPAVKYLIAVAAFAVLLVSGYFVFNKLSSKNPAESFTIKETSTIIDDIVQTTKNVTSVLESEISGTDADFSESEENEDTSAAVKDTTAASESYAEESTTLNESKVTTTTRPFTTTLKAPENPAPTFTVFDYAENRHKLEDFRGRPVIVNVWATWCGYCVEELPSFQKMYEKYGNKIDFMMIDLTDGINETKERAYEFIIQEGYTFPVYYDLEGVMTDAYSITGIPLTVFIDQYGNLVNQHRGIMSESLLRVDIMELLSVK